MHLRHVEVFFAVMEVGTIKGAARTLGASQSRVISVLDHLEVQLGWRLFDRQTGKLHPTPEARRLYQAMDGLVAQIKVVRRVAAAFCDRSSDTVRVVATPSVASALLPPAIARWNRRFPALRCSVATQHTNDIVTRLLLGEADLGLSLQNPRKAGIEASVLASGAMMAAAPPGTWSAAECRLPVPLSLLGERYVGLAAGDPLGAVVQNALDAYEVQMQSTTVAQTHQLAAALVARGHGVALVDPFTAAAAGGAVQMRRCLPVLPVDLFSLAPKETPLSAPAAALAAEVAAAARALSDTDTVKL
jgi:DNA-binding transcriptional LysR family regulator